MQAPITLFLHSTVHGLPARTRPLAFDDIPKSPGHTMDLLTDKWLTNLIPTLYDQLH